MAEDPKSRGPGDQAATPERTESSGLPALFPQFGIAVCFFAAVLGGMATFDRAVALGLGFDDPHQVGNVGVFAAVVLGATVVMVATFRYDRGMEFIRLLMVAVFGWLVALAVVLATDVGTVVTDNPVLEGFPASPFPAVVMVLTAALLWLYPEWYVLNVVGIVSGAAGIAILGISFGPFPIVVLLVAWAAYDAYAVYWSGHMKELAGGATSLKVPVVFVFPEDLGFSIREDGLTVVEGGTDGEESADVSPFEGAILGLGDALIPGMLAVSAAEFLDAPVLVSALNANAPALGTVGGAVVGILVLNYIVHHYEGVHAGLPPLVTCVLAGYLVGAVAGGVPVQVALGL